MKLKEIKEIKDFESLRKLTRTKGFRAMLVFGLAKKLVLLAVWLLPDYF